MTAAVAELRPGQVKHHRRWLAPVAAFVVVLVHTACAVGFGDWGLGSGNPAVTVLAVGSGRSAAPSQVVSSPGHPAVPGSLMAVADALEARPPAEAQGRYSFVSVEVWAEDAGGVSPLREKRWFQAQTRRCYTATYKLPTVDRRSFDPALIGRTDFATAEFSDALYTVPHSSILPDAPTDPDAMVRLLKDDTDGQISAAGMVQYVASLSTDGYPNVAVRVAALRMLATAEGITVAPGTDALGRPGLAVTGDSPQGWKATVIIRRSDGLALAVAVEFPPIGQMAANHWVLILETGRTDTPPP